MEEKNRQQLILNILLILFGGVTYYLASKFTVTKEPGRLGPNFWPQMLSIIIIVFSAADGVISLLTKGKHVLEKQEKVAQGDAEESQVSDKKYPLLLLGGIVSTYVYIFLLPIIGFGIGTALYLAVIMLLGRYRNIRVIISSSLIGSFILLIIFSKIVYLSLPPGMGVLGDFTYLIYKLVGVN